jgi:hypothetical protein
MRLKKRKRALQYIDDDDYIVNDHSGRTGFTGVNHGNDSVTEMSERHYGHNSYAGDEVEHTLGQEMIQQAPFDPFRNNFAFIDNKISSDHHNNPQEHANTRLSPNAGQHMDHQYGGYYDDLQAHDESAIQQTPWATQAVAEPAIPFKYFQHPYASDAVHVTPLRRQPSERAEYGLAC